MLHPFRASSTRHVAGLARTVALAFAIGSLGLVAHARAETGSLVFTFVGNMAVHVTDGETVLVTDFPYESGAFGYMKWEAARVPPVRNGLALVTHRHRDHFAPELMAPYDVTVAGPAEVLRLVEDKPTLALSSPAQFRGIAVEPRPTPHASLEHLSYVVTWRGLRMYFSGDTEDPADLLAARNLDVAFVSPWLYGSVLKRQASVDSRRIVIYHHETGESVPGDAAARKVPAQGESWTLADREPAGRGAASQENPRSDAEAPIVFVCEHGSVKSLVAAQWFNRLARERGLPYRAVFRGIAPDPTLPGHVVENLRGDGFDVTGLAPVRLGDQDLASAKRVVAIGAQDSRFPAQSRPPDRWDDIPPASTSYAASRDAMRKRIDALLDELAREP